MSAAIPNLADEYRKLLQGVPPDWASEWGQDGYGVFLGFSVGGASQILRWIPPGTFMMGSPDDEQGRWSAEGPQHEVTIAEGFWLFETPCTQALWTSVMGNNPSKYPTPDRPVDSVAWNDAQAFIGRINEMLPGLGLSLPSEARWEYACRAGNPRSTYIGDVEILGENNAPGLDAIAWYGGNSGKDFDLAEGYDSSNWKEKQYDHKLAGTRRVKQKKASAFGLYDMLGNVWEWCADAWRDDHQGAPSDGAARESDEKSARRVLRGGSWDFSARFVRSAYRLRGDPEDRSDFVGFRCARVQA
ncbi:Sulphatase-modifying factor protein [Rhodoblastus sphagnicola]|uniref:Sulphatase-modifying factor protein n=1 Tax=Rhodoblastus sphagnicola TaxID=333368 RepID=A0A2S6N213_9HYPH|nr:formylglycine-generating enzyme family protein [Rhodoblastus sphagnicola]MBB4199713.1 formylglycine-generating enzyme required for sulfatase activity [Rhodoblastus sphagnicola]PPQ28653.1 Sulphatase-modifying factor protein [Rhodoblastus sphagnicola]